MLWIIATVIAFFIKGMCGFGDAISFSGILSFTNSNKELSPTFLLLGFPSNFLVVWEKRKHVKVKIFLPISIIVLLGSFCGTFMLKYIDPVKVKILFGLAIILLSLDMIRSQKSSKNKKMSKLMAVIIAITSGVISGMFSTGSLIVAYVEKVTENIDQFKANLCSIFIVEASFRILMYIKLSLITAQSIKRSLMLFPLMVLSVFLGIKFSNHIDEKIIKRFIIVMFMITGINILFINLRLLFIA